MICLIFFKKKFTFSFTNTQTYDIIVYVNYKIFYNRKEIHGSITYLRDINVEYDDAEISRYNLCTEISSEFSHLDSHQI